MGMNCGECDDMFCVWVMDDGTENQGTSFPLSLLSNFYIDFTYDICNMYLSLPLPPSTFCL